MQCRIGMVGVTGVEPVTSSLSGTRSNQLSYTPGCVGGGNGIRTRDFQLAKLALYQLSYAPVVFSPEPTRPNSRVTPTVFSNIHAPLSKQKRCGKHAACVASFEWPRSSRGSSGSCRTIVRILRTS